MSRTLATCLSLYLITIANLAEARRPDLDYDDFTGGGYGGDGSLEGFGLVALLSILTYILGRRDMVKHGINLNYSDEMSVGGSFGKWFLILMFAFIIGLVSFGGLGSYIALILAGIFGYSNTRAE